MSVKHYSLTETAKLIRVALKQAFLVTKFSVRVKSYSMGCSITIYWTDGPTVEQVSPIAKSFEGSHFDGMQDLKSYNEPSEWNGERVTFGTDYVFMSRNESAARVREAAAKIAEISGLPVLEVNDHGCTNGGNYNVPWQVFVKDGVLDLAHDSRRGDWYADIVYRVVRATSHEAPVSRPSTPHYVTDSFINATVEAMLV